MSGETGYGKLMHLVASSIEDSDPDAAQSLHRCANEVEEGTAAAEERCRLLVEALSVALDCKGSFNGTVSERGGDPALCTKCEQPVRAALAAQAVDRTLEGERLP